MKTKNIVVAVIIAAVVIGGGCWLWQYNHNKSVAPLSAGPVEPTPDVIFYYGNTCPHCKDAEEWMQQNNIEQQMVVAKREVYNNKDNAIELAQRAAECGFNAASGVGVPFLYVDGQCYMGMPDVVDGMQAKLTQLQGPVTNNNSGDASGDLTNASDSAAGSMIEEELGELENLEGEVDAVLNEVATQATMENNNGTVTVGN